MLQLRKMSAVIIIENPDGSSERIFFSNVENLSRTLKVQNELPSYERIEISGIAEVKKGAGAPQKAKTHCPKGHPYSGENLYINPRGGRQCRTCRRVQAKASHQKWRERNGRT